MLGWSKNRAPWPQQDQSWLFSLPMKTNHYSGCRVPLADPSTKCVRGTCKVPRPICICCFPAPATALDLPTGLCMPHTPCSILRTPHLYIIASIKQAKIACPYRCLPSFLPQSLPCALRLAILTTLRNPKGVLRGPEGATILVMRRWAQQHYHNPRVPESQSKQDALHIDPQRVLRYR